MWNFFRQFVVMTDYGTTYSSHYSFSQCMLCTSKKFTVNPYKQVWIGKGLKSYSKSYLIHFWLIFFYIYLIHLIVSETLFIKRKDEKKYL